MLIRPTTPSRSAIASVASLDLAEHLRAERHRRDHAGRVAGVHAGLLDVLHDRADPDRPRRRRARRRRSRSRSRGSGRGRSSLPHAPLVRLEVVGQRRRASNRSPSRGRRARSSAARAAGSPRRRPPRAPRPASPRSRRAGSFRPSSSSSAAEAGPVLGQVDRLDRRAQQRHAGVGQARARASAASGRRTGRSRPRAARARSRRARPSSVSGSK